MYKYNDKKDSIVWVMRRVDLANFVFGTNDDSRECRANSSVCSRIHTRRQSKARDVVHYSLRPPKYKKIRVGKWGGAKKHSRTNELDTLREHVFLDCFLFLKLSGNILTYLFHHVTAKVPYALSVFVGCRLQGAVEQCILSFCVLQAKIRKKVPFAYDTHRQTHTLKRVWKV